MRQVTIRRYASHEITIDVPNDDPQRAEIAAYDYALHARPNEWSYLPGTLSFIVLQNRPLVTAEASAEPSVARQSDIPIERPTFAEEVARDLPPTTLPAI
ncbi:MAG TPA: hypothetical protein VD838_23115 [Anaeromyxobacteraceae bacterium]|nr:hypothetical protein [Anaeromyxobacteraceae bacterium]